MAGGGCLSVGPSSLISLLSNFSLCPVKGPSLPLCSSCSGSRWIVAKSGDKNDVWVRSQHLWREGKAVIVRLLARGAVDLVDLGFILGWFWVRSAMGCVGMKCVAASSPPAFRLLCFPVSYFGRKFRASPSYSHGLRRNGESGKLAGDLSFSSSDNNHGFYGDMFDSPFMLPTSSARV